MARQPVIYLPHGGGPWPWMDPAVFGPRVALHALRRYLEELPATLPEPPRALLVCTAHWEARVPTVSSAARPGMLYDYSGFPPETYRIVWPAPGDPALAARVRTRLGAAGLTHADDPDRGYDHGTFVPLAVAWPKAEVPVVQLSLVRGLDPDLHLRVGRALAPLRDEGVLLLGSGMSYHDLRGFGSARAMQDAAAFDAWLADAVTAPAAERDAALLRWDRAPAARACHPREEHLLPLMVVAGAAGDEVGRVGFRGEVLGARVMAAHFG